MDSEGKSLNKKVRQIFLNLDENSLRERLERVRGFTSINQVERLYLVSKGTLDLNEHDRLHFGGTNRGNQLGPIAVAGFNSDDTWKLPVKIKKVVVGRNGRILVGGPAPGEEEACIGEDEGQTKAKVRQRMAHDMEPVFYHALPITTDEEWHHCYDLAAVISLTAGPGSDALTCVRQRKPYFGVTLTDEHSNQLITWLEKKVWKAFTCEKDKLYQPGLAEIISGREDDEGDDDAKNEPKDDEKDKKRGRPASSRGNGKEPKKAKNGEELSKAELLKQIAKLTGGELEGAGEEEAESQSEAE